MLILKNYRAMFIITFLLATLCLNSKPYEKYETMLTDFKNLSVDSSKVYSVTNFTIIKEDAQFNFKSGKFYFCKPINNRCIAAIFIGDATISFKPASKREAEQLLRVLKYDVTQTSTNGMFLFFADNTGDTIKKVGINVPFSKESSLKEIIKRIKEYELDNDGNNITNSLAQTKLDDKSNDFISVLAKIPNKNDLIFRINPYSSEEVQFFQGTTDIVGMSYNIINQYSKINDSENQEEPQYKEILKVNKYTIDSKIEENLNFSGHARLDASIIDSSFKWMQFYLGVGLTVNYVKLPDETSLAFYKPKKSNILWIKLPKLNNHDSSLKIVIDYSGDIIDRYGNTTYLKSKTCWYPLIGEQPRAIFDLTFTTPEHYEFASVGDLLGNEKSEFGNISHWVTPNKIEYATFSIGNFTKKKFKSNGYKDMELLFQNFDHYENVMQESAASVMFFSKLFGPIPLNKLIISESPYEYNGVFPGLLLYPTYLATRQEQNGKSDLYLAHYIAYEWWGINVDFASYHDHWITEGLAEYSALIYLMSVKNNAQLFFEILNDFKENLITYKSFPNKETSSKISPLIGHRYNSLIPGAGGFGLGYPKPTWFFHMLRYLMFDSEANSETKFLTLIKEAYRECQGKCISTKYLKNKVNKIMGQDMDWFFDEWILDDKIPKYKVAYKIENDLSGNSKLKCRVEQTEVPTDFKMYVPITIQVNDSKIIREKKLITGQFTEFEIPITDSKIKNLYFNEPSSVLCEVDNVGW